MLNNHRNNLLVAKINMGIKLLRSLINEEEKPLEIQSKLHKILGGMSNGLVEQFSPQAKQEEEAVDKSKPSILLTSFNGCKGLSGGHVFIVGAHNGSIPKDVNDVQDIEFSQFIVALTRTRKRCHIVSNKWHSKVKDDSGGWLPLFEKSLFTGFIDSTFIEDLGDLNAAAIKAL